MMRPTVAEINLTALRDNTLKLRAMCSADSFFCPMVKADAYGHGAVQVAQCLSPLPVSGFGVALFKEAVELRQAGIDKPVFVFSTLCPESLKLCKEFHLTPVIGRLSELQLLAQNPDCVPQGVHLLFNVGMNRLDIDLYHVEEALKFFDQHPQVKLHGVGTHLSTAEDMGVEKSVSLKQLQMFEPVQKAFLKFTNNFHVFNSAGMVALKKMKETELYQNYIQYGCRPGIALYGGLNTTELCWGREEVFQPVMRFQTKVIHTHHLKKGESLSYGGRWTAAKDTLVGVLPVGYADGFSRRMSPGGSAWIGEQEVPILGTVCMDFCMVELTHVVNFNPSQSVILFGENGLEGGQSQDVAHHLGTISYEVLTSVGKRVPRVYKESS